MAIPVKLGKYIIPHFHKAVAFAPHLTVWAAAAISLAPVVINFRTRPARACAMLPKIIAFPIFIPVEPGNLLSRNPYFPCPYLKSLVILPINRRIQPLRLHADYLCQKFPAPGNSLMFKIIPKRKIPQHLKKCQMPCGLPHIVNISGTDTFLTGGNSLFRGNLLPCKIRL